MGSNGFVSIPPFNHEGILPPCIGSIAHGYGYSPYKVTISEFINYFSFDKYRRVLLANFLKYRAILLENGFYGFQWIDGSFVEDLRNRKDRDPYPHDIDCVTFIDYDFTQESFSEETRLLFNKKIVKEKYACDSFYVDMSKNVDKISSIRNTIYWIQFFSHTRDSLWKGILELPLSIDGLEEERGLLQELENFGG